MNVQKNDTVLVITGKDRGKKGKVLHSFPKAGRVLVEKVNMIKRHSRARGTVRQSGIVEREATISVANVMFLCAKCNHPARIGYRFLQDGKKVRFCRACQEVIE